MNQNNPAAPEAIAAGMEIIQTYIDKGCTASQAGEIVQKHYAAKDAEILQLKNKSLSHELDFNELKARVERAEEALRALRECGESYHHATGLKSKIVELCDSVLQKPKTPSDVLTRLQELERESKALDWLEKQSQKFRDTYALVASEAPSLKPGWKYYVNGESGNSLLEAIESAMEKQA